MEELVNSEEQRLRMLLHPRPRDNDYTRRLGLIEHAPILVSTARQVVPKPKRISLEALQGADWIFGRLYLYSPCIAKTSEGNISRAVNLSIDEPLLLYTNRELIVDYRPMWAPPSGVTYDCYEDDEGVVGKTIWSGEENVRDALIRFGLSLEKLLELQTSCYASGQMLSKPR